MKPRTYYARSGLINIAYQVIGTGPIDIVYVPGWVSNIDLMWQNPELSSFLNSLAEIGRVILFDKRGTGLSDRVSDLSTLEERMDDIRAVMDAVNAEQAILFGHSEGGSASALFAATYPQRTKALITFGVFAKRRYSPDYPWAPTDTERQKVYDMIEANWGGGDMDLVSLAPSKANDSVFMEWLASYFRSGASPSAALVLTKMNTNVDIVNVLDKINVPTLLMQRTDDIDVKIEEGKYINKRIKNSNFVEFPGNDHLFWAGDTEPILTEMLSFIKELKPEKNNHVVSTLSTVLNVSIEDYERHLAHLSDDEYDKTKQQYETILKKAIAQFRGQPVKNDKEGYCAWFDGPIRAVHCALVIRQNIKALHLQTKIGLHSDSCQITSEDYITGDAVNIAQRIRANTKRNTILISQSVKDLITGSGISYLHEQELSLSSALGSYHVFEIDEQDFGSAADSTAPLAQSHSLLDSVLESIQSNLSNDQYSVDIMCTEVGMSERQLQRKLKSIANKSPNQMIRSYRLHKAKDLLSKQTGGVSEVAFKTGFNSVSYFSKCFKKEFGLVPTELFQVNYM